MIFDSTEKEITNREVKSSAFTSLFSEPENAAALYQALTQDRKVRPEDVDYTTLQGVLFMARKNDMAFMVHRRMLIISEHQSTINLNMPLRDAIYYGRTMEKLIEPRVLYKTARVGIPTPEFYVFYNGTASYPVEKVLNLSDAYLEMSREVMLELKVKVININLSADHPLLKNCRPVYEYSWFIQKIRDYTREGAGRDKAIISAMEDCRQNGILTKFLREHGTEASNMLFTEFNMEDALEVRGEEKFLEGKSVGKAEDIIDLLAERGAVSEALKTRIYSESRLDTLNLWLKAAARADSVDEFLECIAIPSGTENANGE